MKKLSVNSPEYQDIVSKLLGKEVKFDNLPIIPIPTSPSQVVHVSLPLISNTTIVSSLIPNKKKPFTGIKDVDLLILKELNDEDLFSLCQVDKYINSLCNNENFWLDKLLKKYPDYKLLNMEAKYKDIYKELFQLEKLKSELNLKQNIYNLKQIDISKILLHRLNLKKFPKYLTDLQTVEYIGLGYYNISEISDLNLPNLQYLNLPNLQYLNLRDNKLKVLPTLNLPKLKKLDLADNQISKIYEQYLPNIIKVNLSGNRLKVLPTLNFPKLEKIDISYNKEMTKIEDQNWPELKSIYMSDAKIKKKDLPANIVKKLARH